MPIQQAPSYQGVTSNYYSSGSPLSADDKKDPRKVGVLFESLFYQMMLKEMRSSQLEESVFDGPESKTYKEMWDNELALQLAERGELGVADMVAQFIQERQGSTKELGMLKDQGGSP